MTVRHIQICPPLEAEHPNVSRSSTDVSTAQAQMLSATATDITGSSAGSLKCARRSRSYSIYTYIYIDLFGLHNLYLFSNWILNPQLKLTNKMSWCPRYYWGDIQIISNNHYIPIALECPNPAQPRTRSRRQRSALLPCTRRSQSFTAPSWCSQVLLIRYCAIAASSSQRGMSMQHQKTQTAAIDYPWFLKVAIESIPRVRTSSK